MNEKAPRKKEVAPEELIKLPRDLTIISVVMILDISTLSVPELLEYGLTRHNVNHAIVSGVIELQRPRVQGAELVTYAESLATVEGDIYFQQFLSSKVRLTELGLYLLDRVKGCEIEQDVIEKAKEGFDTECLVLRSIHTSRDFSNLEAHGGNTKACVAL